MFDAATSDSAFNAATVDSCLSGYSEDDEEDLSDTDPEDEWEPFESKYESI